MFIQNFRQFANGRKSEATKKWKIVTYKISVTFYPVCHFVTEIPTCVIYYIWLLKHGEDLQISMSYYLKAQS